MMNHDVKPTVVDPRNGTFSKINMPKVSRVPKCVLAAPSVAKQSSSFVATVKKNTTPAP